MSKIVKNILFYRLKSQFIYYIILFYNALNLSDFIFRIQPIKITSTKKEKKKKRPMTNLYCNNQKNTAITTIANPMTIMLFGFNKSRISTYAKCDMYVMANIISQTQDKTWGCIEIEIQASEYVTMISDQIICKIGQPQCRITCVKCQK